ncbi:GDSL-type esterase/lipase family protein [Rhodococcus sp. NPDC060086]|uniref:GDSL-type esterase/lipase family protein n=1 Tax=Rhodococcus sp. NPDC060086 TaxID=3347055 RepID=UPI003649ABDF
MTVRPLRLCVFGDSFVAGVGDPAHRGWVGRVTEHALGELPIDLTVYNLGIRRDTSSDVRARWQSEALARFPRECDNRVIMSFGVNDTTLQDGSLRVEPAETESTLAAILEDAASHGWPTLVVGPPPIADEQQNTRTAALDERLAALCQGLTVPYLHTFSHLAGATSWMREAAQRDGAHPSAQGYSDLAELVRADIAAWLGTPAESVGGRV